MKLLSVNVNPASLDSLTISIVSPNVNLSARIPLTRPGERGKRSTLRREVPFRFLTPVRGPMEVYFSPGTMGSTTWNLRSFQVRNRRSSTGTGALGIPGGVIARSPLAGPPRISPRSPG